MDCHILFNNTVPTVTVSEQLNNGRTVFSELLKVQGGIRHDLFCHTF